MIDINNIDPLKKYIITDTAGSQFAGLILELIPGERTAKIVHLGKNECQDHHVHDIIICDTGDEQFIEELIEHDFRLTSEKGYLFECKNCSVHITSADWRKLDYQQIIQCKSASHLSSEVGREKGMINV